MVLIFDNSNYQAQTFSHDGVLQKYPIDVGQSTGHSFDVNTVPIINRKRTDKAEGYPSFSQDL